MGWNLKWGYPQIIQVIQPFKIIKNHLSIETDGFDVPSGKLT